MLAVKVESPQITLPPEVAQKLFGQEVQFIEYYDGFVIKPVGHAIKAARGFLKPHRFSTARYFQMKQEEKDLE